MIYEYAVDPALLDNWADCRQVTGLFGCGRGRLISELPDGRRWERLALEAARKRGTRPVELKSIEEAVRRLRERRGLVSRAETGYEALEPWPANAEREHERCAFRAILSRTVRGGGVWLEPGDIYPDHPLLAVRTGSRVARTAKGLADVVAPLLHLSDRIVLVDPYFVPEKKRWLALPYELLERARRGSWPGTLEIVSTFKVGRHSLGDDQVRALAAAAFPKASLPPGASLRLLRPCGEVDADMHNRYALSELGGVLFGHGLDVSGLPTATDDVSLIDDEVHRVRWAEYGHSDRRLSILFEA